jgi:lysozyme
MRFVVLGLVVAVTGCVNAVEDEGAVMGAGNFNEDQKMVAQCTPASTVPGIDVSYYQDTIDWNGVANDGNVKFAFIRYSDGLSFHDSQWNNNWQGARAAGVMRGAYQLFRSNQNPIAEADALANAIGQLEPGDLPPVIDVETTDGQSSSTIARHVDQWLNEVQAKLGVRPIVYTGPYFWRDSVGGADETASPLWVAHYGTNCPYVPPPWTSWTFHQYTDHGNVQGIHAAGTDFNVFGGTMDQLTALTVGGTGSTPPPPSNPPPSNPPPSNPPPPTGTCDALDASGGIIDNDSACFQAGGGQQWLTDVTTSGYGGSCITTGTTAASSRENFAQWTLNPSVDATYELEVYVGQTGTSRQAKYVITHADGTTSAVINQNAVDGWVSIGAYHLSPGVAQSVVLNDNTGENSSLGRRLTFDGLRVTVVDNSNPNPPPPASNPCPKVMVQGTGSVLNIRPQPNTSQAAIGQLPDGSVVDRVDTVTGESIGGNTNWYKINNGSITGFITAAYAVCHS